MQVILTQFSTLFHTRHSIINRLKKNKNLRFFEGQKKNNSKIFFFLFFTFFLEKTVLDGSLTQFLA